MHKLIHAESLQTQTNSWDNDHCFILKSRRKQSNRLKFSLFSEEWLILFNSYSNHLSVTQERLCWCISELHAESVRLTHLCLEPWHHMLHIHRYKNQELHNSSEKTCRRWYHDAPSRIQTDFTSKQKPSLWLHIFIKCITMYPPLTHNNINVGNTILRLHGAKVWICFADGCNTQNKHKYLL